LRIDGGSASPAVLEKKVVAAAHASSYSIGSLLRRVLSGIKLTREAFITPTNRLL